MDKKSNTMPKKAKELSAIAVSKLKKQGRHAVGGVDGLYLRIAGQSRSWVFSFTIGTRINAKDQEVPRRRFMGLGSFPEVSLADAREKAREYRKMIRDGIDPLEEQKKSKIKAAEKSAKKITFTDCVESVLAMKATELKNVKHLAQWRTTLETYAYPFIGKKCVNDITKSDILKILEPIWLIKNETASRVRGRIETVLDYAKAREYFTGDNPAAWKGCLKPLLPQPKKIQNTKHHAALPYSEIKQFMLELRKRNGIAARALEFSILTVARSNEVRGASWSEIDFESCIWIIPSERMKAGKEHRVPLSSLTINLLKEIPRFIGNDLIFPAPRGGRLSDMSLTAVLKRMDYGHITQHGFRSTFRDWAGETTNFAREVIEHALAHQLKDKSEAAYQRGDLLAKRAKLMYEWTEYCATNNGR